jgi:cytochrome P450
VKLTIGLVEMLDAFGGPNIATASGEQWKKHRKVINTSLNERTNAVVWSESASLGDQMARYWASKKHFTSVGEDVRTFALNILCKTSFGQSYATNLTAFFCCLHGPVQSGYIRTQQHLRRTRSIVTKFVVLEAFQC